LLLYYITDRTQFPGNGAERRERLLKTIAEAARRGVDYVQLREKDLPSRDLESLAREALARVRHSGGRTRLLINSRTDVALATGADGVHLRSRDISPADVRSIWRNADGPGAPLIAVSCHCESEVAAAHNAGADFVVFGPVFEKAAGPAAHPAGREGLRAACRREIPVFALGGITLENAAACREAGAQGISGIRLFQQGDLGTTVTRLRA